MPPELPNSAVSKSSLVNGNKKGMGVSTSAHPCYQAFALPLIKDKQRSQPTPSDYIYSQALYIIIYSYSWDIIYPRRRPVALPL
jgi:hypothetical protein